MTIASGDASATDWADDGQLAAILDTLFEEAERRERHRRSLAAAMVAVLVAAGGLIFLATNDHVRSINPPRGTSSSPALSAASFGDPSSEVVTETHAVDGHVVPITTTVATTLGSRPTTRAIQSYDSTVGSDNPGVTALWIGHDAYVRNAYRARVCDPACAFTSKPWLEVNNSASPPWDTAVMYDPAHVLSALRLASRGTLKVVGTSTVDGVQTTEYRGSVTARGAVLLVNYPRESGLVSDLGALTLQWSHPIAGENPASISVLLWVDTSGLARRLELSWSDISVTEASGPHMPLRKTLTRETQTSIVTLSDFGKPVSLREPTSDDVAVVTHPRSCRVYTPRGGFGGC